MSSATQTMVLPRQSNAAKKFLKRFELCGVLATVPWMLRGFVQARRWKDGVIGPIKNPGGPAIANEGAANPLRDYFDSVSEGRGIWKWLHYFEIYNRHLQKFVGREVRIAEVGIYSGGSLGMWKTYFGPGCTVYGIDIEEACRVYEDETTRVFIGDQGSREFWKRFKASAPFVDILVDDGGHKSEQQIVTLEEMLPHLRPGGVYLCEDIQGTHNLFAGYVHGLVASLNAFAVGEDGQEGVVPSAFQRWIYSVHSYPFITVIEKAETPVERFAAPRHGTEWQPFFSSLAGK